MESFTAEDAAESRPYYLKDIIPLHFFISSKPRIFLQRERGPIFRAFHVSQCLGTWELGALTLVPCTLEYRMTSRPTASPTH